MPLVWSKQEPNSNGYYWWRGTHWGSKFTKIYKITLEDRGFYIEDHGYVKDITKDSEWAGPIDRPLDATAYHIGG